MVVVSSMFFTFLIAFVFWWLGTWVVFWFELVEYERKYDWCYFDNFLKIIDIKADEYKIKYGNVYITKNNMSIYYSYLPSGGEPLWDKRAFISLRPGSICINNYYMMLNPIDYLRYRFWLKINSKKDSTRIEGLWKEGNDDAFTS